MKVLRGPKMTPVFRSKRRALAYARRKANETDHMMGVQQVSARRWEVKDYGEPPPPPKASAPTSPQASAGKQ